MNKPITTISALVAVAFVAVSPVDAQGTSQEKTIKCRFRFYGWDDSIMDLHYSLKTKDMDMVIYQESRSIFYEYTGPEIITFYRMKTDAEGKVLREPAAQANLSDGGPWPLILISNNPSKPGTYQTRVMKDDLVAFPTGTYAFSNFSISVVGGLLGTQQFSLAPGEHKLFADKPKDGDTTLTALFYKLSGSTKEPIYTNNWAIRPATRTRVFIKTSAEDPSGIIARRLVESTIFPPEKKDGVTPTE